MKSVGRRKRWFAATVLTGILIAALGVNAGRVLVVDAPQPSDAIVVIAGETDRRPARALELLEHGYARRILIDVPVAAKTYEFTEIQLAEKYINGLPQAAAIKICPIQGLSTRDESRDVERCLMDEPGSRVLLVTSDFHTLRALAIFRHEIPRKTFSVAAAHDSAQFGARWWTHRQWAKTCLDEWLRLLWWSAVDRWR